VKTIPKILILIGRNTLLIYVVHLVIIYGSAWNKGLYQYFAQSFSAWNSVGIALLMILTMTAMVLVVNKIKIRTKQAVT
jgi:surface polysaccharide O-acyltransferase-like enzyme